MLMITRGKKEAICIGNDIRVVVMRSTKEKVCLGIEAPENVKVYREEIYKRIQSEGMHEDMAEKNNE